MADMVHMHRPSPSPWATVLLVLTAPVVGCLLMAQSVSQPVRDGDRIRFGLVIADPALRTVSFPARLLMTNGLVEYAVVTDYGKTHESLLVTDAQPMDVQSALLLLRARFGGTNALRSATTPIPPGAAVTPTASWSSNGQRVSLPFHRLFALTTGGASGTVTGRLASGPWLFNGSMVTPEGFGAHFDGSIVSLITDPLAIINNPGPDREDDEIHVPATARLPAIGTEVTVELSLDPPPAP